MNSQISTRLKTETAAAPVAWRDLRLQRKCACGGPPGASGECESCRKKRLQKRAAIADSTNALEREADRAADSVSSGKSASALSALTGDHDIPVPPIVHQVVQGGGQPIDPTTRQTMGHRFGHDFGRVRVHHDTRAQESARAVHAQAYTVGSHLVFDAGRYAPATPAGQNLLAHELAHVVQQRAAPGVVQRKLNVEDFEGGKFDSKALETYLANFGPSKIEDNSDSDDKARTIVALWRKGKMTLDPQKKILLIKEMQSGFTGDDDERAILTLLLNSSEADLQVIFGAKSGVDPKDLDSDFQGPEEDELRAFYDRKFEGGREAALKGSRKLREGTVAKEKEADAKKAPEKAERVPRKDEKDVVILLDTTLKAVADTVAPGADVLRPATPEALAGLLKKIKHPIKTLFFVTHSLDNASIAFGHQFVLPEKLSKAIAGSVAQGLEPELIDFRGCRIGLSPPGMELIRSALGAGAAVGGTCYLFTKPGGPFRLDNQDVTSTKQRFPKERLNEGLQAVLTAFGPAKKCVLDPTIDAYFRANGHLIAAWFSPIHSTEFDPLYSKCFNSITPEVVDPDKTKSLSNIDHHCRLIEVEGKKP